MPKMFSVSNAKTIKGESRGFRTFVLYLAAATRAGVNVCKFASAGCTRACLVESGQLGMGAAVEAQKYRTTTFFRDRDEFYASLFDEIVRGAAKAVREGYEPVFRLNGTSDLPWEKIKVDGAPLMAHFPEYQFYDYTKYPPQERAGWREHPNYHLTFSWSEGPASLPAQGRQSFVRAAAKAWYAQRVNTTVVFGRYAREKDALPSTYDLGFGPLPVIDGDETDLRFLDPTGVIVGLRAKFKTYEHLLAGIEAGFILPGTFKGIERRGSQWVRPNPAGRATSVEAEYASDAGLAQFDQTLAASQGNERDLRTFFGVR